MAQLAMDSNRRMRMDARTLGIFGAIGGPMLLLAFLSSDPSKPTYLSETLGLLFLLGWMCSLAGLWQLGAAGRKGKPVLIAQMVFLSVAILWSLSQSVAPGIGHGTLLFTVTDLCWPISVGCMFFTGIACALAGVLKGWRRWAPMLAGLGLPLLITVLATQKGPVIGMVFGGFLAVAHILLGLAVRTSVE